MSEPAQKIADQQQPPPQHYYHDAAWRLRAEAPWVIFTLILAVILSSIILFTEGQFAPDTLQHIVTLGFIIIPTIILIASGEVDLSSGMLVMLVCNILASLCWRIDLGYAILISLLAALGVGSINGLLVGPRRLKGIFVTFGMRYCLYGMNLMLKSLVITQVPPHLRAFARSPLLLVLWILLVLACAVLMIFTPMGRRPQAGEPEPPGWSGRLYKGLPFLFSSLMAGISGVLLWAWAGAGSFSFGAYYTETALLAALLGGTAYYAGTGFVLSGAIALVVTVLLRQILDLPFAKESVILGALLIVMLPIVHAYHARIDCRYNQQSRKAKEAPSGEPPHPY